MPRVPLLRLASVFLILRCFVSAAPEADKANIITWEGSRYSCKCYDGEKCWPSSRQWQQLNATVNGNLHKVIPEPAVCHNTFEGIPVYNKEACDEISRNWYDQKWHPGGSLVSNHWTTYTNTTCSPTTDPSEPCTLGFFPEYVITARRKEHLKAGIDFARNNNLRLVIRNTGHDFMGRSTGYGSLAINTHNLDDIKFIKRYTGPGGYRGPAVTVSAGVQAYQLLNAANQQKPPITIVAGECPTVGFAGGFLQGGGHGPLGPKYGMAVDQVLSFDVVTADGRYVTANQASNPDLFWALKGGGPATFAALVSVTVKTYPDLPSTGLSLWINSTHTTDQDVYWKGFSHFHSLINHYVDNDLYVYYDLLPTSFRARPFVGFGMTPQQVMKILEPLFAKLKEDNIPHQYAVKQFPNFLELYYEMFEGEDAGLSLISGGRFLTRQDLNERQTEIVEAQKNAAQYGLIVGHILSPSKAVPISDSAIHPVWRNVSGYAFTLHPVPEKVSWGEKQGHLRFMTEQINGPLRAATPNGGAYVSEGDLLEPDWQHAYWGSNYPRLRQLKRKWDPLGVFYAQTTPGTEDWQVIDYGRKLCRKL